MNSISFDYEELDNLVPTDAPLGATFDLTAKATVARTIITLDKDGTPKVTLEIAVSEMKAEPA